MTNYLKRSLIKAVFTATVLAIGPTAVADFIPNKPLPPVAFPKLVSQSPTLQGFVPPGWKLEFKSLGDLNSDRRPDAVFVLRDADPKNILTRKKFATAFNTNPRLLAVALSNPRGGFDLALQNHTFLYRPDNPNAEDYLDPNGVQAGDIEIKHGTVRITLGSFMNAGGWGMGHATYTFRFHSTRLELIGYDSVSVERNSGDVEEFSINYLTGRKKQTAYNVSSDDPEKVSWTKLRNSTPPTIQDINAETFAPEEHD